MLVLQLHSLLKRYTDPSRRITVQKLMRYLKAEYGVEVDRRTVKENLLKMQEFGIPVEYGERERITGHGTMQTVISNWYLVPEFEDIEIKYLIDGLYFSRNIPKNQLKDLIEKIEGLASGQYRSAYKNMKSVGQGSNVNPQFFLTLEVLSEAIEKKKQVSFQYLEYGANRRPRPRRKDGESRIYTINPYRVVAANGWYYVICNLEGYEGIAHYRVDRMKEINMLKSAVRPIKEIEGYQEGLALPKHMAEHIYMFSGESVECSFRAPLRFMQQIMDWFGTGVRVKRHGDDVVVTVTVNEQAMFHWALQYGTGVTVLSPESLVEQLRTTIVDLQTRYQSHPKDER